MAVKELRLTPEQAQLASDYLPFAFWLVKEWYPYYKQHGYDAVYDRAINALIKAARNWREDEGANFKTYLALNTKNEMAKINRDANAKKRKGITQSLDATIDEGEKFTLHEVVGKDDQYEFITKEILETLTEREREAILLRFVEGMTQTEIGEALGVTQMHASRIIRKGLAKMREQI